MPVWLLILAHLLNFGMWVLLCVGTLVRLRPPVAQLTRFYFCIALGGALAGVFNGFLAPLLFTQALEYPLVMLMALFVLKLPGLIESHLAQLLAFTMAVCSRKRYATMDK